MNIFINNITNSTENVEVLLKLQEIDRFYKDKRDSIKFKILVWIFCGSSLVGEITLFLMKQLTDLQWSWPFCIFATMSYIHEIEILYVIIIVRILVCKMDKWVDTVKRRDFANSDKAEEEQRNISMFNALQTVIETFHLVTKCFRATVFLHLTFFLVHSLMFIEDVIQRIQSVNPFLGPHGEQNTYAIAGAITVMAKHFLVISMLSLSCEQLYSSFSNAQAAAVFRSDWSSISSRRFAKNVVRVGTRKFTKMNIWGLFDVDASLPVTLGALIATYTIVLLQFAFL